MGVAAVAFLVVNFVVMSGLADEAGKASKSMTANKKRMETDNGRATELLEEVRREELLHRDLEALYATSRGTDTLLEYLEKSLPESLWVETVRILMVDGKEFDRTDQRVPVFEVAGRAEEDVRAASQAFGAFAGGMGKLVGDADRDLHADGDPRGKVFEWSLRAQLLQDASASEEEDVL